MLVILGGGGQALLGTIGTDVRFLAVVDGTSVPPKLPLGCMVVPH